VPACDAAAAASDDSQQLLKQARRAVNKLAMSMDEAEADALFAAARGAVMPLLRAADTSCADSARALLLDVHEAVCAGSEPPADVVEQLLSRLSEAAAAVHGGELHSSRTPLATAAAAAAAPTAVPASTMPNGGSRKRPAAALQHAACTGAGSSNKVPRLLPAHERPPEDADGRPGFWLPGNFYVQNGDTLFVQVAAEPKTISDPCTFTARNSSSSSSNSSNSEEQALLWVMRLESFSGTHVFGRFYRNKQRCLRMPLQFQGKAQRLERAGLHGVFHTLLPGAVLQQLDAELAAEVEAALFEAVEEDEGVL
jgi:hypothetical protein